MWYWTEVRATCESEFVGMDGCGGNAIRRHSTMKNHAKSTWATECGRLRRQHSHAQHTRTPHRVRVSGWRGVPQMKRRRWRYQRCQAWNGLLIPNIHTAAAAAATAAKMKYVLHFFIIINVYYLWQQLNLNVNRHRTSADSIKLPGHYGAIKKKQPEPFGVHSKMRAPSLFRKINLTEIIVIEREWMQMIVAAGPTTNQQQNQLNCCSSGIENDKESFLFSRFNWLMVNKYWWCPLMASVEMIELMEGAVERTLARPQKINNYFFSALFLAAACCITGSEPFLVISCWRHRKKVYERRREVCEGRTNQITTFWYTQLLLLRCRVATSRWHASQRPMRYQMNRWLVSDQGEYKYKRNIDENRNKRLGAKFHTAHGCC